MNIEQISQPFDWQPRVNPRCQLTVVWQVRV